MTALTDFLFPAPAPRRAPAIIAWWERRRLHYNAFVGAAGLFSLVVTRIVTLLPPGSSEMPPLVLVVVFGVLANVCYTVGPAAEVVINRVWGDKTLPPGPMLYRMGLTFSVGLALLPTIFAGLDWGFRILKSIL